MAEGARKRTYAYGKNYRPCPWSQNKIMSYNGKPEYYIPYCTSDKNPSVIGNHAVKVTNDEMGARCIGRCIDGKTYTSCPYYKRMTSSERSVKKKSDERSARRTAFWGDPMAILVAFPFIMAIVASLK